MYNKRYRHKQKQQLQRQILHTYALHTYHVRMQLTDYACKHIIIIIAITVETNV